MNHIKARPQAPLADESNTDHYRIRGLLGEGGFGQVFEAWDEQLCRAVALKRLRGAGSAAQAEALLAEARHAASLRHSAFVRIFALAGQGAHRSIVMELVQGRTLRQFLQQSPPSHAVGLDIAAQVAEAMAEAHDAGLVHGDLKPSNLMIEADGKVRILDFGLARHIDVLATQSATPADVQGTFAYMAPERLLGHGLHPACDIYALGMLLYEMLAGQRPFAQLNGLALAAAHLQAPAQSWPLPPHTDPALAALVQSMTARDPAQRAPSMRVVLDSIARMRGAPGNLPGAAPESAPPAAPPRKRRLARRPLLWGGAALLLLVLGGAQAPGRAPLPAPYSELAAMQEGLAALYLVDRRPEQETAVARFTAVLEHNPHNAAAAAGLSLANSLRYIDNGRDETLLQRADASAQLALGLDDQLALAQVARAWVAEFQGREQEALAAADAALRLDPHDRLALYGKARLLIHMQSFDAAAHVLDQARTRHPDERLFVSLSGTLRFRQGDYRGAEAAFRRCIALDPQASSGYANLNQALLRQDRGEEALAVLQQGLRVRPDWTLYTNLGTSLFARGDYIGAVRAFEHAVSGAAGNPHNYLLWANLADAQRWVAASAPDARRSYRHAVELLAPLLARTPRNPTFLSRMALYQAHLGEREAALAGARQAAALAPRSPDVQFRVALASELAGERDAALASIERAAALGYPLNAIGTEPDLLNLRRDARFLQLHLKRDSQDDT
jgi:serine/threonine-protein kinase